MTIDISAYGIENTVSLCASCKNSVTECPDDGDGIIYGTNKKRDNVVACPVYLPVHTRDSAPDFGWKVVK